MKPTKKLNSVVTKRGVSALLVLALVCSMFSTPFIAFAGQTEYVCGKEEHAHTEGCYAADNEIAYSCVESLHVHSESCFDQDSGMICGYADYYVHTHDSLCYSGEALVCPLSEHELHTHEESCYEVTSTLVCEEIEEAGHSHGDECYETAEGFLCGLEESEGHTHTEDCYTACTYTHEHSEACIGCGMEESEGHVHDEGCTSEKQLICELEEVSAGHAHGDECYQNNTVLSCGLKEATFHTHADGCFEDGAVICGQVELLGHEHTDECMTVSPAQELTCKLEEHAHDSNCLSEQTHEDGAHVHVEGVNYYCGMEAHTHDLEACYDASGALSCSETEHVHSDACATQDESVRVRFHYINTEGKTLADSEEITIVFEDGQKQVVEDYIDMLLTVNEATYAFSWAEASMPIDEEDVVGFMSVQDGVFSFGRSVSNHVSYPASEDGGYDVYLIHEFYSGVIDEDTPVTPTLPEEITAAEAATMAALDTEYTLEIHYIDGDTGLELREPGTVSIQPKSGMIIDSVLSVININGVNYLKDISYYTGYVDAYIDSIFSEESCFYKLRDIDGVLYRTSLGLAGPSTVWSKVEAVDGKYPIYVKYYAEITSDFIVHYVDNTGIELTDSVKVSIAPSEELLPERIPHENSLIYNNETYTILLDKTYIAKTSGETNNFRSMQQRQNDIYLNNGYSPYEEEPPYHIYLVYQIHQDFLVNIRIYDKLSGLYDGRSFQIPLSIADGERVSYESVIPAEITIDGTTYYIDTYNGQRRIDSSGWSNDVVYFYNVGGTLCNTSSASYPFLVGNDGLPYVYAICEVAGTGAELPLTIHYFESEGLSKLGTQSINVSIPKAVGESDVLPKSVVFDSIEYNVGSGTTTAEMSGNDIYELKEINGKLYYRISSSDTFQEYPLEDDGSYHMAVTVTNAVEGLIPLRVHYVFFGAPVEKESFDVYITDGTRAIDVAPEELDVESYSFRQFGAFASFDIDDRNFNEASHISNIDGVVQFEYYDADAVLSQNEDGTYNVYLAYRNVNHDYSGKFIWEQAFENVPSWVTGPFLIDYSVDRIGINEDGSEDTIHLGNFTISSVAGESAETDILSFYNYDLNSTFSYIKITPVSYSFKTDSSVRYYKYVRSDSGEGGEDAIFLLIKSDDTREDATHSTGGGKVDHYDILYASESILPTISLTVNKTDGTTPLAGAGFTLYQYDEATTEYVEFGTQDSGAATSASFSSLPSGQYKLVETTVPTGYTGAEDIVFTVDIAEDGEGVWGADITQISGSGAFAFDATTGVASVEVSNTKTISVTKEVLHTAADGTQTWAPAASYSDGDTIPYRLTGTLVSDVLSAETYKYIFHDNAEKSIIPDTNSIEVTIGGNIVPQEYYSVDTSCADCTLAIKFENIKAVEAAGISLDGLPNVVVEYDTLFQWGAAEGGKSNVITHRNDCYIEYNNGVTETSSTAVISVGLISRKYFGYGDFVGGNLEGVTFELYKFKDDTWQKIADVDPYSVHDMASTQGVDDFFDAPIGTGKYKLVEAVTPNGYTPIEDIVFELDFDPVKFKNESENQFSITITSGGSGVQSISVNDIPYISLKVINELQTPPITKETKNLTNNEDIWAESTTAVAGDTISFKLTGTLPGDLASRSDWASYSGLACTFHDKMDSAFTLDQSSISVSVGDIVIGAENYTIGYDCEDCSFTIDFADLKTLFSTLGIPLDSQQMTIEYNAVFNPGDTAAESYQNTAHIVYNEYRNNIVTSEEDTVMVTDETPLSMQLHITKVGRDGRGIADAGFTLYKYDDGSGSYLEHSSTGIMYYSTAWFNKELTQGKYKLSETTVPEGYLGAEDIFFEVSYVVDKNGNIEANITSETPSLAPYFYMNRLEVKVENVYNSPYVGKKLYDVSGDSGNYNPSATYTPGSNIPFALTGTFPDTFDQYDAYKYIFHDTMDAGLVLNSDSVSVTIGGQEVPADSYSLISTGTTDGCSFEVLFEDVKPVLEELKITDTTDAKIVVSYTAKLLTTGTTNLTNKTYIEYSSNPGTDGIGTTSTSTSTVKIGTNLIINKVSESGDELYARFRLYKLNTNTGQYSEYVSYVYPGEPNGLSEGQYKLEEITIPIGYAKPEDIEFLVSYTADENGVGSHDVLLLSGDVAIEVNDAQSTITVTVTNYAAPAFTKRVMNVFGEWQSRAVYNVGDSVPFIITGGISENIDNYDTYKYIIHDTMDAGLAFDPSSLSVTIGDYTVDERYYNLKTNDITDGCTFELEFTDIKPALAAASAGSDALVTVRYSATYTTYKSNGNTNSTFLEVSIPNGVGTTDPSTATVTSVRLTIYKIDENETSLAGAAFKLQRLNENNEYEDYLEISDETSFVFYVGLGQYKLIETTTPDGFITAGEVEFEITAEETGTIYSPTRYTINMLSDPSNNVLYHYRQTLSNTSPYLAFYVTNYSDDVQTVEKYILRKAHGETEGEWSVYSAAYCEGEAIPYRIIGTLPANLDNYDTYQYTIYDEFSGFNVDISSIVVSIDGIEIDPSYYQVSYDFSNPLKTFNVQLTDVKQAIAETEGLTTAENVVLEYDGYFGEQIQSSIQLFSDEYQGSENECYIKYTTKNGGLGTTKTVSTAVYTYRLNLLKVSESGEFLDGAEYMVQRWDGSQYVDWQTLTNLKNDDLPDTQLSMGEGRYKLVETKAPDGYRPSDIEFEVSLGGLRGPASIISGDVYETPGYEHDIITIKAVNHSDAPTVTKTVKDVRNTAGQGENAWVTAISALEGEVLSFRLAGTLPASFDGFDSYPYIFHDRITGAGGPQNFTLDMDSIVVKIDNNIVDEGDYTIQTVFDDAKTFFEIEFTDIKIVIEKMQLSSARIVTVEYDAEYTTAEATYSEKLYIIGPNNMAYVLYGPDKEKTDSDSVAIGTGGFRLSKHYNEGRAQADSEFMLQKWDGIQYVDFEGLECLFSALPEYTVYHEINGIPDGQYRLVETETPQGYIPMEHLEFNYSYSLDEGVKLISLEGEDLGDKMSTGIFLSVENEPIQTELPKTGGPGTHIYYLFGALITAAGIYISMKATKKNRFKTD